MVAKTKTDTAAPDANPEPAKVRKTRVRKPVNDLPTAVAALNASARREDRAKKAYLAAVKEYDDAQKAQQNAKDLVKKFYAETVGDAVNDTENVGDADYEDVTGAENETSEQA